MNEYLKTLLAKPRRTDFVLVMVSFFRRVMYIDLDLHHGNGVESAFYHTPNVLTYSLHKFEAGFYPGSGDVDSIGEGRGRGYSVNIPLKDGASDHTLKQVRNANSYNFNVILQFILTSPFTKNRI